MTKSIIIWVALITVTLLPLQSFAATNTKYMLTERYNQPFCDVDKTNKDDGKMCWAASISNMVGFSSGENPLSVFDFLKKKYSNDSNSMYGGLKCIFKFFGYTVEDLLLITSFSFRKVNKRIDLCIIGMLYQGEVVNICVDKTLTSKIGHALTVYGFETVGRNIYIFYVDSNDGIRKLYRERIKHREGVTRITTGYYKGYVIDGVVGLNVLKRE